MKLPRWMHRVYAMLGGYFWLPCPICGRMFGGHEIASEALHTTPFEGSCVCKNCGEIARERNRRNYGYGN